MSQLSWQAALTQTLATLHRGRPPRVAVLGIGHELRGDDAAGLLVARGLQAVADERLMVVEAGHAPENHTGRIRRHRPDLILLIDAAQLNEPPGTIRWLPAEATSGLSASTHTLPPYMLTRFLQAELGCELALLGVQPAGNTLGAPAIAPGGARRQRDCRHASSQPGPIQLGHQQELVAVAGHS